MSECNPWEVLREIAELPLVAAADRDDPINGCDAVDHLCVVRKIALAALAEAPGPRVVDRRRQNALSGVVETWTLADDRGPYAFLSREGTDPETRTTRVEICGALVARFEGRRRVSLRSAKGRALKPTDARLAVVSDALIRAGILEGVDVIDHDPDDY